MPALNIIAIHDTVRNSGSSSSAPSGMLPNRPIASQITKTTNADASRTKSQPMLCTVQSSAVPDAVPRVSVLRKPQARKARAITAVTPNTTRSILLPRALSSTITGVSRTGWTGLSGGGWAATLRVSDSGRVSMLTRRTPPGGATTLLRFTFGGMDVCGRTGPVLPCTPCKRELHTSAPGAPATSASGVGARAPRARWRRVTRRLAARGPGGAATHDTDERLDQWVGVLGPPGEADLRLG